MLVGLAVYKAPGVEPGAGVVGASDRVFVHTGDYHSNQIAFCHNSHDVSGQFVAGWCGLAGGSEIIDHTFEAGSSVGIVLDVTISDPVAGISPVIALQQLAHDVQGSLRVAVFNRIGVSEK